MLWVQTWQTVTSWNSVQARPASTRSLVTVLIDVTVTREIERRDDPSTSRWRMTIRFAMLSRFLDAGRDGVRGRDGGP